MKQDTFVTWTIWPENGYSTTLELSRQETGQLSLQLEGTNVFATWFVLPTSYMIMHRLIFLSKYPSSSLKDSMSSSKMQLLFCNKCSSWSWALSICTSTEVRCWKRSAQASSQENAACSVLSVLNVQKSHCYKRGFVLFLMKGCEMRTTARDSSLNRNQLWGQDMP